ncbi:MAG: response regulator receiver protein [Myxococcales bacterium]|nr:response regulator receiver protein [Myxococcales bacterium]
MKSVLVVEDDDDLRDVICRVLTEEGYETRSATNGQHALEILRDGPLPGLILLDLMMPIMNGWAFRAHQEADARLTSIPVIVMTAAAQLDDAAIAGTDFVRKPVRIEDLLERVRSHIGHEFDDVPPTVPDGAVLAPLDLGDTPIEGA